MKLCVLCLQILSLIEEAAGTRLYESKKEAAQKTIGKKDAKLREMDSVSYELFVNITTSYVGMLTRIWSEALLFSVEITTGILFGEMLSYTNFM